GRQVGGTPRPALVLFDLAADPAQLLFNSQDLLQLAGGLLQVSQQPLLLDLLVLEAGLQVVVLLGDVLRVGAVLLRHAEPGRRLHEVVELVHRHPQLPPAAPRPAGRPPDPPPRPPPPPPPPPLPHPPPPPPHPPP